MLEPGQLVDAQCVTYFVNHMISIRPMGPCCEYLMAAAIDGVATQFAELRVITPRDFAMNAATSTLEFLRMTIAQKQIVAGLSRFVC